MRILLANYGTGTSVAIEFVAAQAWPVDSTISVVTVIDPATVHLPTFLSLSDAHTVADDIRYSAALEQEEISQRIVAPGRHVTGHVAFGPAARTLSEQAGEFRADLLVIGATDSRGSDAPDVSVGRKLLDIAPCPVVIARRPSISRAILATDGSTGALRAEQHVLESPALAGIPILIVSVAEAGPLVAERLLPALGGFDRRELDIRLARHRDFADQAARRLAAGGREVAVDVRAGDVAIEIAAAAFESGADVVILGSDDRRGLSRVVLGSVARDVMDHTDSSVLVVRAPAPTRDTAVDPQTAGSDAQDEIDRIGHVVAPSGRNADGVLGSRRAARHEGRRWHTPPS